MWIPIAIEITENNSKWKWNGIYFPIDVANSSRETIQICCILIGVNDLVSIKKTLAIEDLCLKQKWHSIYIKKKIFFNCSTIKMILFDLMKRFTFNKFSMGSVKKTYPITLHLSWVMSKKKPFNSSSMSWFDSYWVR